MGKTFPSEWALRLARPFPKKSGNRYIGLVWNEYRAGGEKCGAVFQVDEENYTLLLKVLERFTGKQAVDSEKP